MPTYFNQKASSIFQLLLTPEKEQLKELRPICLDDPERCSQEGGENIQTQVSSLIYIHIDLETRREKYILSVYIYIYIYIYIYTGQ